MAEIKGTSGNDSLTGTDSADDIYGLGGDDTISGLGGYNTIEGGDGNDILIGGDDGNSLRGGAGNDTMTGGAGTDSFDGNGSSGDDIAYGGGGYDYFNSDAGADTLYGEGGNDTFYFTRWNEGADHIIADGGDGDDRFSVTALGDYSFDISGGAGADRVEFYSFSAQASVSLGAGSDVVAIHVHYLSRLAEASVEILDFETGEAGDRLEFLDAIALGFVGWDHSLSPFATGHMRLIQSGADTLLQIDRDGGGNGYATAFTFRGVDASAFTPHNLDGYSADGTIPAGQTYTGTDGEDRLIGMAGADTFHGLGGLNIISGGAGDDTIHGGADQDRLYGQVGNDWIDGGDGGDEIDGGYGTDTIFGGDGDDYISSERGADIIDGGAGFDQIYLSRGSLTNEVVTAAGGSGNDIIGVYSYGSSAFHLDGGAGDDLIQLRILAGTAYVTLGDGSDEIDLSDSQSWRMASSGHVVISDFATGEGGDLLDFSAFVAAVATGWDGSENPFGTGHVALVQSGADVLLQLDEDGSIGAGGSRTLVTFENRDVADFVPANLSGFAADGSPPPGLTIVGTEDSDLLTGGGGPDTIDGLGDADTLEGGAGDDLLRGGDGYDILHGGTGADTLEGGDGGDSFDGGAGSDVMRGGAGIDYFLDNAGSDQIYGGDDGDNITVQRHDSYDDYVQVYGEGGADSFTLYSYASSAYYANGGSGDDRFFIGAIYGHITLNLGNGADTVTVDAGRAWGASLGLLYIEDFTAVAGGDVIDLKPWLEGYLTDWDPATNPFETGFLRVTQAADYTTIEIDQDGAGDSHPTQAVTLLNFSAAALGVANIGYDVSTLHGTEGDDVFTFTSLAQLAGRRLIAAGGTDTMALHGNFSAGYRFAADAMSGIDRLELRSAEGAGYNSYKLTMNDANVAAGETLTVDGSSLRYGENIYFYGQAETDGRFDIRGGGGNDYLFGGRGADMLSGGAGSDRLYGGLGNDVYLVLDAADQVNEGAGEGTADEIRTMLGDTTIAANVEILTGIGFGQILRGDARDNIINGGAGNDTLHAEHGGADRLSGGGGDDVVLFGAGFSGDDRIAGGAGNDTVMLAARYATGGLLQAQTLTGVETILLGSAPAGSYFGYNLTLDDGNVAAGGRLTIDGSSLRYGEALMLYGGAERDGALTVLGGASLDYIFGGQAGDTIRGGLRADRLSGDGGDDRFEATGLAELSGDRIDGGAGSDTLALSGGVSMTFAGDTMVGVETVLLGSAGGSGYFGYNLTFHDANVAAGQTLTVDGSALLRGETMMVYGSAETDGRFVLLGGVNNDYLHGGAGDDRFTGGLGRDYLRGNRGADTFVCRAAEEATGTGFDQLYGFDWREDRIDLATAVSGWNGSASGALSGASFDSDLAAAVDGALQANGALLFTASAGNYAGRAFLVVDGNGDGAYSAGQDYVIELLRPAAALPGTAEFFI